MSRAARSDKLFQRRKFKTKATLERKSSQKEQFPRILIIPEGSKTEPKYFKALLCHLGFKAKAVRVEENSITCPLALAKMAFEVLAEDPDFDQIYVVFDRDGHGKYFNALDFLRRKRSKKVYYINSNPCFEFWFYLHVKNSDAPINSDEKNSAGKKMCEMLKGSCDVFKGYEKGNFEYALDFLLDNLQVARKNSQLIEDRLSERGEDLDTANPFTRMHQMLEKVEELLEGVSKVKK